MLAFSIQSCHVRIYVRIISYINFQVNKTAIGTFVRNLVRRLRHLKGSSGSDPTLVFYFERANRVSVCMRAGE